MSPIQLFTDSIEKSISNRKFCKWNSKSVTFDLCILYLNCEYLIKNWFRERSIDSFLFETSTKKPEPNKNERNSEANAFHVLVTVHIRGQKHDPNITRTSSANRGEQEQSWPIEDSYSKGESNDVLLHRTSLHYNQIMQIHQLPEQLTTEPGSMRSCTPQRFRGCDHYGGWCAASIGAWYNFCIHNFCYQIVVLLIILKDDVMIQLEKMLCVYDIEILIS